MISSEKQRVALISSTSVRCCLVLALLLTLAVLSARSEAGTGLAEYEQPWEICALCHSLDGNSRMAKFPKLAGQDKEYIEKQLNDFVSGHRHNDGGQMSSIVTEVNPEQFSSIAQWFASQTPPVPQELDTSETKVGEALFLRSGCISCHNDDERVNSMGPVPLLTSQHAAYLVKQLSDFQRGQREHVDDAVISEFISTFDQSELMSISNYLAATPRQ